MLTVGDKFPQFQVKAVVSANMKDVEPITEASYPGQWKVYFFYPKAFTALCPTEITEFGRLHGDFVERNAVVLGASTDSDAVQLAWRNSHADLKDLPFPLLSDVRRDLSGALGILHKTEGVCLRATFIVDPDDVIRFVAVNDLAVGRSPKEVLRVLDGLQSGAPCPCNWEKGQDTL